MTFQIPSTVNSRSASGLPILVPAIRVGRPILTLRGVCGTVELRSMLKICLSIAALFASISELSPHAQSAEPNRAMLNALRPLDGFIGIWKGTGTSQRSAGWTESITVNWGFREKDGRVSINFVVDGGQLFEAAVLTFDPDAKLYRFIARPKKGDAMRFEGKPFGRQTLRLERADKDAKDNLDRLDLKLVRSGAKLVYAFSERKGATKSFEQFAQVDHFLEGPTAEEFKSAPKCIVTGGAGRIAVEHAGRTVHVACEGCKEEFLSHPDRYVK